MHNEDRLGAWRDCGLDQRFVEIERVGTNVDEDRYGTAQHDGIRGRNEGERWHDHLVTRLKVEQQRGHLERGGARVGQQCLGRIETLLQPLVAAPRKAAITGSVRARNRLPDIVELITGCFWAIEIDRHDSMLPARAAGSS